MPRGKKITQEKLDQAAMPDMVAMGQFTINTRTVKIKPLKIRHQKEFAKAIAPVMDSLAIATAGMGQVNTLGVSEFMQIAAAFLNNIDCMPTFIRILCHNDGYEITDHDLDEQVMSPSEMQGIVLACWKQGGEFEREIADFFENVLKTAKGGLRSLMQSAREEMSKEQELPANSTSIA